MIGVVDLEKIEQDRNSEQSSVKDTWLLRLPKDVCDQEGLAEGTLISLTIKNGGIQSSFVKPPSKNLREIGQIILEQDRELHQRLKELGD